MQKPLVTIIVPNYNEAANLKRGVLTDLANFAKSQTYPVEILISDDGSTDDSLAMIADFSAKHENFTLLKNPHHGKPYALRAAIKKASGQYVLFTDMDQSTPISELNKLTPYISKDYKIVIGSRGVRRTDSALYRQLASVIFLLARRMILLPEIKDTQCGFKLLEISLARKIFANMRIFGRDNHAKGWKVTAYDVELLHLAKKYGHKIKEVRVAWKDEDTSVGKNRNFLKESYEMLFEIMRVRINDLLGKYNP
ncbi:MAG: Glycosyl transferase family 2 [Microgenomates group bacterium GW2011_GWF2_47_9]|nr:MAG: Glycosyl transferase family 2 [Microgenomates group bacterium GW2011_GWF2_47_9]